MVKAPWHDGVAPVAGAGQDMPRVTEITRWNPQPGDRLIVHVSSFEGVGPGYVQQIEAQVRDALGLDDAIAVVVVAPGIRVEVVGS